MGKMLIMDHSGHETLEYDVKDKSSIEAAERRFKELTGVGFTAAEIEPGQKSSGKIVREFNPNANETLLMPRVVGG